MKKWCARALMDLPEGVWNLLPWRVIWWAHFHANRID